MVIITYFQNTFFIFSYSILKEYPIVTSKTVSSHCSNTLERVRRKRVNHQCEIRGNKQLILYSSFIDGENDVCSEKVKDPNQMSDLMSLGFYSSQI